MAKWTNGKLDAYVAQLEKLQDEGREYMGRAIHTGAKVVADAMRREIQAIPVAQKYVKPSGPKINTLTSVQKKGLLDGFGISKMRQDGDYYNVKLGFAGYNGQRTDEYPNGVPNSIIARSVVSGTSFREKNDFVGRVIARTKGESISQMEREIEEAIKKLLW